MSLSPIEKTRLSGQLLRLRAQLMTGTLKPLEKARVSAEALSIRKQLGALDRKPPVVDAETAAELETDDGLSDDPNSPNYRYADVGYIPGSRKEEAAGAIRKARTEGRMLRSTDIDFAAIEETPRQARALVVKSNLFGVVDWDGLKEQGTEPAAAFLMDRVYASIAKEPTEDSAEARKAYVLGLETLRTRLELSRTSKEVVSTLTDIREELLGSQLDADEAEQYQAITERQRTIGKQTAAIQNDENRAQWLLEHADYFKVSAAKIEAMKAPVLVRVRTSEVNRAVFAVEANQDDKLAMTATEKARSDAKRLDSAMMAKLADGDLSSGANRSFVNAFLQSLGDAEAAQYLTSDGNPTASLISRVQAALFAGAYSDDRLLELTADVSKPEIANIVSALNMAAPDFMRAKDLDQVGAETAGEKVADSLELSLDQEAVNAILDATNMLRKAKESGMGLEEFLRQGDMFGGVDPAVAAMALFISKNNRSAKRLGTAKVHCLA